MDIMDSIQRMDNTIYAQTENASHELYEKYHTELIDKVKDDPFYSYYYNLIDTGINKMTFFNRKLIKTIDETWIVAIETALPHLKTVVEKPRTFIEEHREVLNVGKVKKITVESIRHLTQHSEFIDDIDEDEIKPNRLLDILKEDSYNTYENRFVFSLIKLLKDFVDKRMKVLSAKADKEDGVLLKVDSNVDNYSEVITYNLEMRIRTKEANDENGLMARLMKINKEIQILVSSGFYNIMNSFPLVKNPIVKTNAIKKNKDYIACYNLWNFIYAYNKVGYKVELVEQDPRISREFEKDIFNSMLIEYIMLREYLIDSSLVNVDRKKRKKEVSVALIGKFMQELVREYDISESELRMLILKELNKAQKVDTEVKKQAQLLEKIKARIAHESSNELQLVNDEWESFFNKDEESIREEKQRDERRFAKKKHRKRKLLDKRVRDN